MTSAADLEPGDASPGRFVLTHTVDLENFNEQRAAGEAAIAAATASAEPSLVIDFGEVEAVNSLEVALMAAWYRYADEQGCALQFAPLPEGLQLIVDFSGLDDVLPLTPAASNHN